MILRQLLEHLTGARFAEGGAPYAHTHKFEIADGVRAPDRLEIDATPGQPMRVVATWVQPL